ncbi:MAG: oligosaccharide flippase family protein [Planctomycetaceae bacterium]|nr:oligosaccharide flippase family protein [Planctomycetaceae bacterium]
MSLPFDNPEYPSASPPPVVDTLADSVVMLLALTVVQRLVGFGRAVLFCRWLPPEQLGLWDMTFSFLLVAAPLAVVAIPGCFGRYLEHYRQRGQLRAFLHRTATACAILAMLACLGVAAGRQWFSSLLFGTNDQADLIALAAGCLATVIAYNFLIELFTAMRNIRLVSAIQLANSVAFAVLGVGLLLFWHRSAQSVLLSYGGSCLVGALMGGWFLICSPKNRLEEEPSPSAATLRHRVLWSRVLPFAAWLLLVNVLINLFEVVDRYMIVHFSATKPDHALDLVGNYHASRLVPMLLVSLAVMLGAMIMPHLSHDWESGHRKMAAARLRLFLKLVGLAMFATSVAVVVAAPLLFDVALRGKFPAGQTVLPWTLVYCTWFGLWIIAQNYLFCAEKAWLSSVSLGCGLVANVILNLLLLPRCGLDGAVWATAGANALSLWLLCRFNSRLGFHLDDGTKLVLVLSMLVCLGPWVAIAALAAIVTDLVWGNHILHSDEKLQVTAGIVQYARRMGLERWLPAGVGAANAATHGKTQPSVTVQR